jgi:hypothetical protein
MTLTSRGDTNLRFYCSESGLFPRKGDLVQGFDQTLSRIVEAMRAEVRGRMARRVRHARANYAVERNQALENQLDMRLFVTEEHGSGRTGRCARGN